MSAERRMVDFHHQAMMEIKSIPKAKTYEKQTASKGLEKGISIINVFLGASDRAFSFDRS